MEPAFRDRHPREGRIAWNAEFDQRIRRRIEFRELFLFHQSDRAEFRAGLQTLEDLAAALQDQGVAGLETPGRDVVADDAIPPQHGPDIGTVVGAETGFLRGEPRQFGPGSDGGLHHRHLGSGEHLEDLLAGCHFHGLPAEELVELLDASLGGQQIAAGEGGVAVDGGDRPVAPLDGKDVQSERGGQSAFGERAACQERVLRHPQAKPAIR